MVLERFFSFLYKLLKIFSLFSKMKVVIIFIKNLTCAIYCAKDIM